MHFINDCGRVDEDMVTGKPRFEREFFYGVETAARHFTSSPYIGKMVQAERE